MSTTKAPETVRVVTESDAYEALLPGRAECQAEFEALLTAARESAERTASVR